MKVGGHVGYGTPEMSIPSPATGFLHVFGQITGLSQGSQGFQAHCCRVGSRAPVKAMGPKAPSSVAGRLEALGPLTLEQLHVLFFFFSFSALQGHQSDPRPPSTLSVI